MLIKICKALEEHWYCIIGQNNSQKYASHFYMYQRCSINLAMHTLPWKSRRCLKQAIVPMLYR